MKQPSTQQPLFEIERWIQDIFDDVFPVHASGQRAFKPFLCTVMGALVVDQNRRQLLPQREYYRVDFEDFLDYSTSELPSPARLRDLPDRTALLFEGFERAPAEAMLTTERIPKGVSLLDAVLAREGPIVSVTARFRIHTQPPDDTVLVTMTFVPTSADPANDLLIEWSRYTMMAPVPGYTDEWKYVMSGTYIDALIDEARKMPTHERGVSDDFLRKIEAQKDDNHLEYGVLFELAHLCLHLRSYLDFMYDLIITEHRGPELPTGKKRGRAARQLRKAQLRYRVIRSVRITRSPIFRSDQGRQPNRAWRAPSRPVAVAGHWRKFAQPHWQGRTEEGQPVAGRTWVHAHRRHDGATHPPPDGEGQSSRQEDSGITIYVKQTLAAGRDLIEAMSTQERQQPERVAELHSSRPTDEWIATERSKLTAGLRYIIMKRDAFRCQLCGTSAAQANGVVLEVDHKKPVTSWGTTTESNLWTLCRPCNRGKGRNNLH